MNTFDAIVIGMSHTSWYSTMSRDESTLSESARRSRMSIAAPIITDRTPSAMSVFFVWSTLPQYVMT